VRHLTTIKDKKCLKTFILLHRQLCNLTYEHINKMNIFLHLLQFMLLIHTHASPRKYASNLESLIETLQKNGITTNNISHNFHYHNIEKLPPLAYIPSDLKNFHNQLTHSWDIYAANKENPTVYPPTNVNPSCNSFTYKVFHWSPLQWTRILDSSLISTDFQMIHLKSPSHTHVTIMQTNASQNIITISHASLQETFLFMSKLPIIFL